MKGVCKKARHARYNYNCCNTHWDIGDIICSR